MYTIGDFFKDVFCFIRHIPDAFLFLFVYACGARPYKVIAKYREIPSLDAECFCNTLLPPTIKADSWEGRVWAISQMSDFAALLFKSYEFKKLEPMPFFEYLWDEVLMPFEF